KSVRLSKGISATEMVARLGVLGWEVANSSLSQIESGSRILGDRELLLILKVLGLKLSDLESGKR
ncbi:MAG TPA: helix-turn-helix domain-containing protein, partial [Terrimicrobiaceae bacterium]|nr:helix-turn-helix domain-containing protein [Terrimicrobiaceae bacterium]